MDVKYYRAIISILTLYKVYSEYYPLDIFSKTEMCQFQTLCGANKIKKDTNQYNFFYGINEFKISCSHADHFLTILYFFHSFTHETKRDTNKRNTNKLY